MIANILFIVVLLAAFGIAGYLTCRIAKNSSVVHSALDGFMAKAQKCGCEELKSLQTEVAYYTSRRCWSRRHIVHATIVAAFIRGRVQGCKYGETNP